MENLVNQRLNVLVDTFERGIKSAFAQRIGISQQGAHDLLSGRKGAPSFKVISGVLENYPQVRAEWLILGKGKMLNDESAPHIKASMLDFFKLPSKEELELGNLRIEYWKTARARAVSIANTIEAEWDYLHQVKPITELEKELLQHSIDFVFLMRSDNLANQGAIQMASADIYMQIADLHKRMAIAIDNGSSSSPLE